MAKKRTYHHIRQALGVKVEKGSLHTGDGTEGGAKRMANLL